MVSHNGAAVAVVPHPAALTTIETIDPDKAYEYLATAFNDDIASNRKLRAKRVGEYARQMKEGRWHLNGETIKFDTNGVLRDGQHRLYAVIQSGCTVEMEVRRGIDPAAADLLDMGLVRTPTDVLYMHGEKEAGTLAIAAYWQYAWEHGIIGAQRANLTLALPGAERAEVLAAHPGLRDFASEKDLPRGMRRLLPKGLRCWLMYRMHAVDEQAADRFWESLIGGAGLEAGSPVHQIREILIANLNAANKLDNIPLAARVVKAWVLFLTGERREQLVWRSGEPFPSFERPSVDASRVALKRRPASVEAS